MPEEPDGRVRSIDDALAAIAEDVGSDDGQGSSGWDASSVTRDVNAAVIAELRVDAGPNSGAGVNRDW